MRITLIVVALLLFAGQPAEAQRPKTLIGSSIPGAQNPSRVYAAPGVHPEIASLTVEKAKSWGWRVYQLPEDTQLSMRDASHRWTGLVWLPAGTWMCEDHNGQERVIGYPDKWGTWWRCGNLTDRVPPKPPKRIPPTPIVPDLPMVPPAPGFKVEYGLQSEFPAELVTPGMVSRTPVGPLQLQDIPKTEVNVENNASFTAPPMEWPEIIMSVEGGDAEAATSTTSSAAGAGTVSAGGGGGSGGGGTATNAQAADGSAAGASTGQGGGATIIVRPRR